MVNTIFGIFNDPDKVSGAINDLKSQGYSPNEISILKKNNGGSPDYNQALQNNQGLGALTGVISQVANHQNIDIPGAGSMLASGQLASLFSSDQGEVKGAVENFTLSEAEKNLGTILTKIGIPPQVAQVAENKINQGATFLAVPEKQGNQSTVQNLFNQHGGENVNSAQTPIG